jgi:hypothetical protein
LQAYIFPAKLACGSIYVKKGRKYELLPKDLLVQTGKYSPEKREILLTENKMFAIFCKNLRLKNMCNCNFLDIIKFRAFATL